MGYKISMITIKNPMTQISEEDLLVHLGFGNLILSENTTLDVCMCPRDKSVNIGTYNNCIIICDDYQLTSVLETQARPEALSDYEDILSALYPGSEILTVACHSVVDYHMYSLVKGGEKFRFKIVSSGTPVRMYGEEMEEEKEIYAQSVVIDGERLFRDRPDKEEFEYYEDAMMEEFTFNIAARHLGVNIIKENGDELLTEIPFRKYKWPIIKEQPKNSWFSRLFGKK
ncbi:hypothetical protein SAMN05660461_1867 [Chitinophaga ginsengisegetis]|uniref:Uncharacterized protein n=1 Tax=Chitinophaga ginsengisegetis TaxID=393003 RepID=A0A1T5NKD9_9BACT|nr:hypothetical protein [Chitinophaga ginsengisegetis]SKD00569.1 hypothetical protein SAMN05660461_1867 [Chitinophaga ginsengisegetis]